jgi:hypothetical protein
MATTMPARLSMTRGRRAALIVGVPVCVALIGGLGLNVVALLGEATYSVSEVVPVNSKSLNVGVAGGDLRINQTTAPQATLTGTARYSLVRSKVTEQSTSDGTTIAYHCSIPFGDCGLNATVNVPAALSVTANTGGGNTDITGATGQVNVSSGGGDITANHDSGPLTLHTSGGNVRAAAITSPTVTVSSGGGDIDADGLTSINGFSASTSGGNIQATGVKSPVVTASTGGGDIEVVFATVPNNVNVNTSGGNITLVLPPGSEEYHVTAHTDGGQVNDALPKNDASKHTIVATSGGGNINIINGQR